MPDIRDKIYERIDFMINGVTPAFTGMTINLDVKRRIDMSKIDEPAWTMREVLQDVLNLLGAPEKESS